MSTTIRVRRICQHCGKEFTAQTTVTKYCSHRCSQRAYKARKRAERVEASNKETQDIIAKPIGELKAKPFLSIPEACKLFGISRRTIYRMITRDELSTAKAGARTILRRSDFDILFGKPKPLRLKKEPEPVTEFYTVLEIERLYFVKYSRLHTIIRENNIPKTMHNGKLHVSKPHIDRYFRRVRNDVSHISEWYTVQEIQEKYSLSRDQIYSRTHDNNVPKQRIGRYVKISKRHFDELFEIRI